MRNPALLILNAPGLIPFTTKRIPSYSRVQLTSNPTAGRRSFSCAIHFKSKWQEKVAKKNIKKKRAKRFANLENSPSSGRQKNEDKPKKMSISSGENTRRESQEEILRTQVNKALSQAKNITRLSSFEKEIPTPGRNRVPIRKIVQFPADRQDGFQTDISDEQSHSDELGPVHGSAPSRDDMSATASSQSEASSKGLTEGEASEKQPQPQLQGRREKEPGQQRVKQHTIPNNDGSSAKPSASVLVISPKNEVLLIHRVQSSSSFPSAHVFPGGNIEEQDGALPDTGLKRHQDSLPYRNAALRELFEETGIVLAKNGETGQPLELKTREILNGRHAVYYGNVKFQTWLTHRANQHTNDKERYVKPDTDGLIPFTHWITPTNVEKRFSTQMYLYFLPFDKTKRPRGTRDPTVPLSNEELVETKSTMLPSSDGGLENTAAEFATARQWLERAKSGEIILFPPQYLLLHLISQHLDSPSVFRVSRRKAIEHYEAQRQKLRDFITNDGDPPWTSKFISPWGLMYDRMDNKTVLGLDKPGIELTGYPCKGDSERVLLVKFEKKVPREIEVRSRKEVFEEQRWIGISKLFRSRRSNL